MKIRAFVLIVVLGVVLGSALAATQKVSADTCYDVKTKQPIPCPPSEHKKKPTPTDLPPTKTPVPTATSTPEPTATSTPEPTATLTPVPSHTQVAAVIPPPPPASGANRGACSSTSPLAGLLAGMGLLAAGIILRTSSGASGGASDGFAYPQTQDQSRVINTAFGDGSVRADERLSNAGPVSGSGGDASSSLRAVGLARALRLARLVALPALGSGGLLMAVAAAQYGGLLSCASWLAPVTGGGFVATGLGLVLGAASVLLALILAAALSGSVKYSLFLPDGTPYRGTVHLAMKNPSGSAAKTSSDSSKDDDSDGDKS